MKIYRAMLLLPIVSVLSFAVSADEGVLEINQVCAVNSGCFAGDSAGFPVTIVNPGSYRLTGNLDVRVADDPPNTDAITIDVQDVRVDLGGFEIRGPAECSGDPVSCTNTGSGRGVAATDSMAVGFLIQNGIIRGMGRSGVESASLAREIRAFSNGHNGIGAESIIECKAFANGARGFSAFGGLVSHSIARVNGEEGILAERVDHAVATRNGEHGIQADTVFSSRSTSNGGDGISSSVASVHVLGSTVTDNSGHGINMPGNGGLVVDSVVNDNGGLGLRCESPTDTTVNAYRGNVLRNNGSGAASASCVEIGTNLCDDNTTCP